MAYGGTKTSWAFGPFRVTRARRLVERNDEVVRIGSRAFDILVYLLEHAGQVVSHRALLEAAWPGTYVEEGNLRFQMAVLRKALGNGEASYIINVPGRGYCFTAPLSKQDEVTYSSLPSNVLVQPGSPATPPATVDSANILPYPTSQLRRSASAASAGREKECVAEICIKLDDLALAIDLVASQAKVVGISRLSGLLEEYWLPRWPDDCATPPKSQTLYAMLDWSYRLLSEKEKCVFRYISVFYGVFDLEAANAVADKSAETAPILTELASRSLLSLSHTEFGTRYRFLDAARRYARDRLVEANEVHEARRRHAFFFMQALQNVKCGHSDQSPSKILTSEIDDVLAAVIWSFTPGHDSTSCRLALEKARNSGWPKARAWIG
jgi:DNA-binding winged helix-turn-helix (wHTH) protein